MSFDLTILLILLSILFISVITHYFILRSFNGYINNHREKTEKFIHKQASLSLDLEDDHTLEDGIDD